MEECCCLLTKQHVCFFLLMFPTQGHHTSRTNAIFQVEGNINHCFADLYGYKRRREVSTPSSSRLNFMYYICRINATFSLKRRINYICRSTVYPKTAHRCRSTEKLVSRTRVHTIRAARISIWKASWELRTGGSLT
jgi:hypothetical protein